MENDSPSPSGMEMMPLLIDWSEVDPFESRYSPVRNHEDNWILSASTRRERVAARILASQLVERSTLRLNND